MNLKKISAFIFYVFLILIPTLFWIKLSWGLRVIFSLNTLINLMVSDLSFLLTVISFSLAFIIGVVTILLKQFAVIQTEQDIYYSSINNSENKNVVFDSDDKNDTSDNLKPPPPVFINDEQYNNILNSSDKSINIEKEPIISIDYDEDSIVNISDVNYFGNILKSKGYRTFDVKSISGFNISFFAVSNKNILFGYSIPFVGEIIANETMPEESTLNHPLWFSSIHRFMSPVFAVKEIRKAIDDVLQEVLPKNHDITIESYCIIDDKANILNINDVQPLWNDSAINVVMYSTQFKTIPAFNDVLEDNSTNEILPSFLEFAQTLAQYFVQKARIALLKKV